MLRVNGLFGWVRSNDQRSLLLFGGFILALQFAAALTLYVPLAGFDEAHAPFLNWGGYAMRYVPLVALAGLVSFAAQMFWHVHSVRRLVAFSFVDHSDERRLCDIIEPLAISMGLPAPYVGVIESPALNAFACGIRRGDAVVVVTRGLINGLDDEELGAVIAHELAHIANGDIRLMAAANICLGMLRRLMLPRKTRTHPLVEVVSVPVLLFVMPPMFVAALTLTILSQVSVRAGHLVRAVISASREFIADAAAVEATQNPAALVSALKRIEGRSRVAGMLPGQDSMMIDGAASGPFATHPTIAQRVKAVVAVTGSMALIAPSRRDTRPALGAAAAGGFGRRVTPTLAEAEEPSRLGRLDAGDGRNWLGLTWPATLCTAAALVVFLGMRGYQYRDPARIAADFDPRPAIAMVVGTTRTLTCGISQTLGGPACAAGASKMFEGLAGQPGVIGRFADEMRLNDGGKFSSMSGAAPPDQLVAEVKAKRCFTHDTYTIGQFGMHPVASPEMSDDGYDISRWLISGDESARAVVLAGAAPDAALKAYVDKRKDRTRIVHQYFGPPGIDYALQRFSTGDHVAAVAALRLRLQDPSFMTSLPPTDAAEMQLLADSPSDFVPCKLRRPPPAGTAP